MNLHIALAHHHSHGRVPMTAKMRQKHMRNVVLPCKREQNERSSNYNLCRMVHGTSGDDHHMVQTGIWY